MSQFLNGHPTGMRPENPGMPPSGYQYPGPGTLNVTTGGMPPPLGSHSNPQVSYMNAPLPAKSTFMGQPPLAPGNQSDMNPAWGGPLPPRDINGIPGRPYNPNQLQSEFNSMHISGAETQNLPDNTSRHGPPMGSLPPGGNFQGFRPGNVPPSNFNTFSQPHGSFPPMSSTGPPPLIRGQHPIGSSQASSFQNQPPVGGQMPPVGGQIPPLGGQMPPVGGQMPPLGGQMPPVGGQMPPLGGQMPPLGGQLPPLGGQMPPMPHQLSSPYPGSPPSSNQGRFPPNVSEFQHGPPGLGAPAKMSQHDHPPGFQQTGMPGIPMNQNVGYNSFQSAPPSRPNFQDGPVTSQPFPGPTSAGHPSQGFQGPAPYPGQQQAKFQGPLPDGSYGGAAGFQHGPPYLSQGGSMSQPPSARRLDPDQMPSQVQVVEDDKNNKSGTYQTGQRGAVPPLVTTKFIAEDHGTCNPRFLRSTMYNVPCTGDALKQSHLPFAVILVPFARLEAKEMPPPIVDLGQMGPVRCNRCKAYMCPGMVFVDGGRKFQCCFCGCVTEVPPEYFAHLDHMGSRIDRYERPELCLGAYEFVATAEYCKENKLPQPPAFIFMIDVSYNSVKSGLVNLLCAKLKQEILQHLPKDVGDEESEVRIGFVTYGRELHFYNIKSNLVQPQMLVVSDINDVFVPLVDGFLVKLSEAEVLIDSLLAQISQMFSETRETESILGPVIQAGLDALKSSERTGKLIIFHSSMPTSEAPGKLKMREDKSLLGTDKEKTLLTPQDKFYTKLGQDCVAAGCSVNIFLFPNSYIDVATIAEVPRLTGGSLYKYNYFQADLDGDVLLNDLRINISRQVAFDVVLRLRTSTGIRAVDFLGNFYMSNTTDVELASVDSDKSIAIEIKHDDKLTEAEGAYVQAAVLYTSVGGRRRLRILNTSYTCCTQVADLFRNCELDSVINYMAKSAIRESLNSNTKQMKEHLTNQCVQILACYRKNCANPSSIGQLILPECMKLLPVYVNCILRSSLFQTENINTDDRSYYINLVNSMTISDTVAYFYPRLLPLHELDVHSTSLPSAVRCTYEKLKDNGAYLLENGLVMFLWVGLSISADWLQEVFGVSSVAQVDIDKTKLQDLDNLLSVRIRGIVKKLREERHRHMKLIILRQRDKLEPLMQSYLVEDRTPLNSSSLSYVDFLCHIHKEIRNILVG